MRDVELELLRLQQDIKNSDVKSEYLNLERLSQEYTHEQLSEYRKQFMSKARVYLSENHPNEYCLFSDKHLGNVYVLSVDYAKSLDDVAYKKHVVC